MTKLTKLTPWKPGDPDRPSDAGRGGGGYGLPGGAYLTAGGTDQPSGGADQPPNDPSVIPGTTGIWGSSGEIVLPTVPWGGPPGGYVEANWPRGPVADPSGQAGIGPGHWERQTITLPGRGGKYSIRLREGAGFWMHGFSWVIEWNDSVPESTSTVSVWVVDTPTVEPSVESSG